MTKRISSVFLALIMVVSVFVLILTTNVSAATYTQVKRFDSSASTDSGYKVISSYPTSEYIATYEVIFNGTASDASYENADPIFLFATPYVNMCIKPTKGKAYIADGGFGGANPTATKSANYAFEWGKYYKIDFVMTTSKATIRINGIDLVSYSKAMTYTSDDYIILCPARIQMDFLSDRLYYINGVCHHDVAGSNTGNNNILYKANGVVTWTNSNDYNSATISAFDLEALHKTAYAVENADRAYYNYSDSLKGMRGTFTGDNGYSEMQVNGANTLLFDYQMEFDFVWWGVNGSDKFGDCQFAGGTNSWVIGYNPAFGKWGICGGNPWTSLFSNGSSLTYDYILQKGQKYHWKLRVTTTKTELWIDDLLVVSSTTYKRQDSQYFIFYPKWCIVDFTNFDWFIDVSGTWQRWGYINVCDPNTAPIAGQPLCNTAVAQGNAFSWAARGAAYATAATKQVFDSGESISYANTLYNNLSANDKARIRTTALTQGTNAYNAQAAIADIGTVAYTTASKNKIDAARAAYNNTDSAYRGKIRNYSTLTAAEARYTELENQANADDVISKINAIGTVTADSGTKITTAENAYAALTADQKALVTNYSTLTTARSTYDKITNAIAKINAIGTPITLSSSSKLSTALSAYNAVPSASRKYVTNYSTYTGAKGEYDALKAVYDAIAAIGTVTLDSDAAITAAENAYNALAANSYGTQAERQGRITNYSTLDLSRKVYTAMDLINQIPAKPTTGHGSYFTNANNAYKAVPSASRSLVTNYSEYTTKKTEYNELRAVYNKIDAIGGLGAVVLTDDCHTLITDARAAYNAIAANDFGTKSERQKRIGNRSTLGNAEKIYNALEAIDALNSITIAVDSATETALSNALSKYNTAGDSLSQYITNYSTYTAAQAEYDELKNVHDLIEAIGGYDAIELTDACYGKITAARAALDALTGNTYGTASERKDRLGNRLVLAYSEKIYTAMNNIAAIGTPITLDSADALSTALSKYNAVPADLRSKVKNYSTYTGAQAEYDALKNVYDLIDAIGGYDAVELTTACSNKITAARTAIEALTDNAYGTAAERKARVTNKGILGNCEKIYDAMEAIDAIGTPITLDSAAALTNANTVYKKVPSSIRNKVKNVSVYTGANGEYTALKAVFDAIADIGEVTVESGSAITSARGSYDGLAANTYGTKAERQSRITNYATLSAAEAEYGTIRPVYESIANLAAPSLSAGDAAIAAAETAYEALTAAQQAKITNYDELTANRAAYEALKPTAGLSSTLDSSKIKANIKFELGSDEDPSAFTVTFGDVTTTLDQVATTAPGSTDGKIAYVISVDVPARQMSEELDYSISAYGETYVSGSISVQEYAETLAEDENNEYGAVVQDIAEKMLTYGKVAEEYFSTTHESTIEADAPTATVAAPTVPFDGMALQTEMYWNKDIPVYYSAMNVTFKSDTTLSIALNVKQGRDAAAALAWVNANVTLGGSPVSGTVMTGRGADVDGTTYTYIVISMQNVPISQVKTQFPLTVTGVTGDYNVGVIDYINKAQRSSNEYLVNLTKALYEYATAVEALAS